jgi:hypothetical protein
MKAVDLAKLAAAAEGLRFKRQLMRYGRQIALILVLLGRSKQPGRLEMEARITRDRTIAELKSAVALTAVTSAITGPAGRFAGRSAWGLVRKLLPARRKPR